MKGKVLGYDGQTGAIVGENGERFAFGAAEWKDKRVPQPRDEVDFVPAGGMADQIYVVRAAGVIGADVSDQIDRGARAVQESLSRATESDTAKRALAAARAKPQLVIAAVILLASILFTYADVGAGPAEVEASLVAFNGELDDTRETTALAIERIEAMSEGGGLFGAVSRSSFVSEQLDVLRAQSAMLKLAYLLYLVPVLAVWALYLAFRGKRKRLVELGLGAASLFAGGYYLALRGIAASAADRTLFGSAEMVRESYSFGLGGWIVVLGGVAMLLSALGIIKARANPAAPGATAGAATGEKAG